MSLFALFRKSAEARLAKALSLFEIVKADIAAAVQHAHDHNEALEKRIAALADLKANNYIAIQKGEKALRGLSRLLSGGE